jgi:two-component system chemotaxis response regulator CheB
MENMEAIKVLIVEDSLLFRNLLSRALSLDPQIQIVAEVGDPYQARDAIIKYEPDVMTLDLELPKMSGLEFLQKLMPQYPIPTVVISSLSDKVFDCLNAGAVEFVNKPSGMTMIQLEAFVRQELIGKIKIAAQARVRRPLPKARPKTPLQALQADQQRIIAIGASTGGTEAICSVLTHFPANMPGIVVVQHMPPGFTQMYAERLNRQCAVSVKEAQAGDRVLPGQVLLAPGDKQMRLIQVNGEYQVDCRPGEKISGHCPSVDCLFQSVAKTAGAKGLGIILTGMGGDGAKGLLAMRQAGAVTIGQDENTCIVYGMPKVAMELGAVQYQLPLEHIPGRVCTLLGQSGTGCV